MQVLVSYNYLNQRGVHCHGGMVIEVPTHQKILGEFFRRVEDSNAAHGRHRSIDGPGFDLIDGPIVDNYFPRSAKKHFVDCPTSKYAMEEGKK